MGIRLIRYVEGFPMVQPLRSHTYVIDHFLAAVLRKRFRLFHDPAPNHTSSPCSETIFPSLPHKRLLGKFFERIMIQLESIFIELTFFNAHAKTLRRRSLAKKISWRPVVLPEAKNVKELLLKIAITTDCKNSLDFSTFRPVFSE